jgi:hypothetical protein
VLFHFSVTEFDPAKPWMIVSTRTGLSLEASSAEEFRERAQQEWPAERYTIELAPGELSRALGVRRL